SSGLGLALTRRVILRGDLVVATARDITRFEPLLSDPIIDLTHIYVLTLDVTSPFSEIQDVITKAVAHWGRIDVLVNNAGKGGVGLGEEIHRLDIRMQFMLVNYVGTVNVTNATLPYMRARREGTVLLIGSRSVYRNELAVSAVYIAMESMTFSTHLVAYGETLSYEMLSFNIRVTVVAPGMFDTALGTPPIYGTPISDYDSLRDALRKRISDRTKTKNKGDPEKGMNALVDLVHAEGRAEGKEGWPLWLFLGDDSIADIRVRAAMLRETSIVWEGVGNRVGVDDDLKNVL
ncbi:NAD-P-binding protein, partial [Amylostereum chailletii]